MTGTDAPKRKFPRSVAVDVAREIVALIQPLCTRLIIAGSLRRRKSEVGDLEIVFIPQVRRVPIGLFGEVREESLVDDVLAHMTNMGTIARRTNAIGSEMWGAKNKLARHVASELPVDFFIATEENWFNYIVCRTGGAQSNIAIASAARAKGWKWNPYDEGFSRPSGLGREVRPVQSEREVFEFAGLEYREPWERE